jgi:hypothetical protein
MRAINFMKNWLNEPRQGPAFLLVLAAKGINLVVHNSPAWLRVLANGNVRWAGAVVEWAREELRYGSD